MTTNTNYFTTEAQISEVIGDDTVVHGTVVIEYNKFALAGNTLTLVGTEKKNIPCRFKTVDGQIFICSKNHRKFFKPGGKFINAIITK